MVLALVCAFPLVGVVVLIWIDPAKRHPKHKLR